MKVAGSVEMSDCDMVTMSLIGPSCMHEELQAFAVILCIRLVKFMLSFT